MSASFRENLHKRRNQAPKWQLPRKHDDCKQCSTLWKCTICRLTTTCYCTICTMCASFSFLEMPSFTFCRCEHFDDRPFTKLSMTERDICDCFSIVEHVFVGITPRFLLSTSFSWVLSAAEAIPRSNLYLSHSYAQTKQHQHIHAQRARTSTTQIVI